MIKRRRMGVAATPQLPYSTFLNNHPPVKTPQKTKSTPLNKHLNKHLGLWGLASLHPDGILDQQAGPRVRGLGRASRRQGSLFILAVPVEPAVRTRYPPEADPLEIDNIDDDSATPTTSPRHMKVDHTILSNNNINMNIAFSIEQKYM
jgi:hypothetical protein